MYITISPQSLGGNFSSGVSDFVAYLEKENESKSIEEFSFFFDQNEDRISAEQVIFEIDHNTAKLKNTEPKFYSITVNPSKAELAQLSNKETELKYYTREIMKDYAASFNREINGRAVTVDDIKYFAKIEHARVYKGTDKAIRENAPFHKKIVALKNELNKGSGILDQNKINCIKKQIDSLEKNAPHQLHGQRIVSGMPKPGPQSHVHIIVSRKDLSNTYSLSPGSKYKASQTVLYGKQVKRGFHRDLFFEKSEKTFDRLFGFQRNFVESYQARKALIKDPKRYFSMLMNLPTHEKAVAFKILNEARIGSSILQIRTNQVQLAIKTLNRLKKGIGTAINSGSIGI